MPAVLFEDDEHGDVGLAGVGGIDGADDAADEGLPEVGHDGEVWPRFQEVVIGEYWVGLS